jgi:3-oxoacyl-[acyl-carrier protein] reductase
MTRKIVVTGASSDIGLAVCKKIIGKGDVSLLQCFRNMEKCLHIRDMWGDACEILPVDFTMKNELDAFCHKLEGVDILINAAGVMSPDLLVNFTDEQVERMIDVNIIAFVKISRAAVHGMMLRRSGIIVNISSVAAQRGNRGQSVYSGTKGFMESFTRALASEYGARGVRINCVAPGPIEAGKLKNLMDYASEKVNDSVASPRLGTPEDVAAAVAFLCSSEAGFINGRILSVDGGFNKGV